jgi:hypothetical protein
VRGEIDHARDSAGNRTGIVRNPAYGRAMSDDYWWEPPLAGTEAEQLTATLDRQRATFRWKADGLDAAGLDTRIGASALTIGGLLKHLSRAENDIFTRKLSGAPQGEPWDSAPEEDWDFTSAATDSPEDLYALYDATVVRDREILAKAIAGGLDQEVTLGWGGQHLSLRRLLCDLIEEYGRHTGHADLLREAVDGRVGEDPPAGWTPVSNADGGFRPL